ncbi:MAG: hypothetical protein K0S33_3767 [Bacteroidetes bacterium]|jgi:hypothetical protein|nr:hypothetical protein [Bacteroidota bacterium]
MKRILKITLVLSLLSSIVVMESCTKARDCRGRKKTVKTNMGGWL